ncbi:hypothetical protein PV08_10237 [Exophiala spinifera]|uniref:BTB domain-containing protein n=1 Tax=Exophiala spinifera TaxID=91928 RepID=A0A0D2AW31_9EURO|nr:uncharacterized protein PV08_10237 [Exophiala spinifera]KIW10938.1 hypothetical protein PV08_10237 [Exophiala spinifera]
MADVDMKTEADDTSTTSINDCGGSDTSDESDFESFATSPIVTILVGSRKFEFFAHKDKLVEKSPFFQKCLGAGMQEAQTDCVILPEDNPKAFGHFIDWIYRRGAPKIVDEQDIKDLLRTWVMADKFCMPRLQNKIMNALALWCRGHLVAPDIVLWVVTRVAHDSKLFSFVLDQFAWECSLGDCEYFEDEDLMKLLAVSTVSTRFFWATVKHAKEDPCEPAENIEYYHVPE